jgi:hypothetical protein
VGFYTVGPAAHVDNGAVHTAFEYLNSSSVPLLLADGAERARDKFHLHFDTVKKSAAPKVQMFSLSKAGAMTLQPIMLKSQDAHKDRELVVLHCRFALSCAINSLRPAALTATKTPAWPALPELRRPKTCWGKKSTFSAALVSQTMPRGLF